MCEYSFSSWSVELEKLMNCGGGKVGFSVQQSIIISLKSHDVNIKNSLKGYVPGLDIIQKLTYRDTINKL